MNPLIGPGYWQPPSALEDERSLETDVMRFMALLGFCLMAVFALIQAIPVSQQTGGVGVNNTDLVAKQLASVREQLETLRERVAQAATLLAQQAQAIDNLETNNRDLRQTNVSLVQRQTKLEAQLAQLDRRWREQRAAVRQQTADLAVADRALQRLQQDVDRERDSAERLQHDITELSKQLRAAMQPPATSPTAVTEPAKPEPVPSTPSPTPSTVAPPASPQPDPVLTMRFGSTAAIERLIADGRVVLYGVVDDRAWASSPAGQFVRSKKPARPYQLTESPGRSLINRFRRGSGLVTASAVKWWVNFDNELLRRISLQISDHRSGELVINGAGRVAHHQIRGGGS